MPGASRWIAERPSRRASGCSGSAGALRRTEGRGAAPGGTARWQSRRQGIMRCVMLALDRVTDGAQRSPALRGRRRRSGRGTAVSSAASERSLLQTRRRPRGPRAWKRWASFSRGETVVDDPDDGLGRRGEAVEAPGGGPAHELSLWPGAGEIRRAIGEGRVARGAEEAEPGRGLAAGPRGVPEAAGEAEGDAGWSQKGTFPWPG